MTVKRNQGEKKREKKRVSEVRGPSIKQEKEKRRGGYLNE